MQDDDLRDRFEEWAGPLRATPAPGVAALRSRIRRRTAKVAAAAGSALAVVGLVAGLLIAGGLTNGGKPSPPAPLTGKTPSPANAAPPAEPYVFINSSSSFVNQGNLPTTPAELKNAATGKVVKVLQPVGQGESFTAAAAAPGDRLFVLAQQNGDGSISFAELRIGPAATCTQVGGCTGVPESAKDVTMNPVMPGLTLPPNMTQGGTTAVDNMTVNAAGTRLAFFIPSSTGLEGTSGLGGSLVVYNLQTGALIGRWTTSTGIGISQFVGTGDKLIASVAGVLQGQNRVIDTSAAFRRGSSLAADSRPYRSKGFPGSFSQDGNLYTRFTSRADSEILLEYSAASGKLLRRIAIGPASASCQRYFCGVLWSSANGDEMLTQYGTEQARLLNGHVTRVRLPWLLPASAGLGVSTFAW